MLSFCLGKQRSFVWAVTGADVNLYQLPAENQIAAQAQSFSAGVQSGREASAAALSLSRSLFEQLPAAAWAKPDWLLSADGVLLNGIPFSALPDIASREHSEPLVAHHSLRALPSELLLLHANSEKPLNRFVGVGDPIYNLADARRARNVAFVDAAHSQPELTLGRLAGSDREIHAAAAKSGLPDVELLAGSEANGAALRKALARTPRILHFAVHVVSPNGQPDQAALALSLTKDNLPELLTRETIASYHVPGSLVVLSGCSSGQGTTLPSAGLIGLSRAWLLAGADAVVVTSWPTVDDSGRFFSAFYSHLQTIKTGSLASRASIALQQTKLEMLRSSGYRSTAAYWAAYSIVSKE
ncbi:MAG: CHAT domain-containing protein [Acidobacteriaceae bacterium]|nr:CHAT domain-containing protein [Acidobacteriaceae bacterium]